MENLRDLGSNSGSRSKTRSSGLTYPAVISVMASSCGHEDMVARGALDLAGHAQVVVEVEEALLGSQRRHRVVDDGAQRGDLALLVAGAEDARDVVLCEPLQQLVLGDRVGHPEPGDLVVDEQDA